MNAVLEGVRLAVIGGDDREIFLVPELQKCGAKIIGLGLEKSPLGDSIEHAKSFTEIIAKADALILPMFGTDARGLIKAKYSNSPIILNNEVLELIPPGVPLFIGWARPALISAAQKMNIDLVEIANRNEIVILNSIPSAEGAVQMAMEATTITIHSSESFVLGLGRCGMTLVNLLKGMGAKVTCVARKPSDLARAVEMGVRAIGFSDLEKEINRAEIVFNTVPALILGRDLLNKMSRETVIIDIASIPGGIDFEYAQMLGIKAQLAPGLPGIVAPKTAGKMLAKLYPPLILEHLVPAADAATAAAVRKGVPKNEI
ncbi:MULTISPECIES: dipicolinate synthase subunit DpsA [Dehalobacter]|jgi:dipicolinate synthase subunit A|uniref:Dipicolinate synthase subunit DpsA n=2 Tax=Dehalobacter restrictus TaxID=55583 RepID=A0A857DG36_9FIRM|nr:MULTISPECIES: dipicolinate synthase subunit DpsA [Dehalobacter]AHF09649.1 dipicolinate synthase [Dehalobacter restrictus DSM 9455]MCG1026519.1 dipicolinate synthase subunit DpsA [Dehalobacter sp.]MDJ0304308.1 dipicolinate synthase subunit DpsA [Dehalobacter sp.]OCZ54987.1 dipicolinic acid synthetase subunit A [Dehalobacter sp. TeCB1]QHA00244.1 dipicolinate synthase subunit DpsA [Dehalobacter restrictus]